LKLRPRIRDEFGEQRSSRRRPQLSHQSPRPSIVAALAACVVLVVAIVLVLVGSGNQATSANAPPKPTASGPAPQATPAPPPKPTFTEADWAQARELAEQAKKKAAEADAARDQGDEAGRKKLRAEALDLYERAITIWQKTSALPDAQQNLWNDKYGDSVHRWFLAKRKLM
jgi:hypothetical protein